jgi:GNAT superfamily N-acetyltransferase
MNQNRLPVVVRQTEYRDFPQIIKLAALVYHETLPWGSEELASHLEVFPEGQFVAVDPENDEVVGMAASLVVLWDAYDMDTSWQDFTDNGMFTNHDIQHGHTLYGAEVMVHPQRQGRGIGKAIYQTRFDLARRLKLVRIRAGARLRCYHRYADRLTPEQYTEKVVHGELGDPTLSFQLRQGFRVLDVVPDYLHDDPESLGYAAVIEWINDEVAEPEDYGHGKARFEV